MNAHDYHDTGLAEDFGGDASLFAVADQNCRPSYWDTVSLRLRLEKSPLCPKRLAGTLRTLEVRERQSHAKTSSATADPRASGCRQTLGRLRRPRSVQSSTSSTARAPLRLPTPAPRVPLADLPLLQRVPHERHAHECAAVGMAPAPDLREKQSLQ